MLKKKESFKTICLTIKDYNFLIRTIKYSWTWKTKINILQLKLNSVLTAPSICLNRSAKNFKSTFVKFRNKRCTNNCKYCLFNFKVHYNFPLFSTLKFIWVILGHPYKFKCYKNNKRERELEVKAWVLKVWFPFSYGMWWNIVWIPRWEGRHSRGQGGSEAIESLAFGKVKKAHP